MAEQSLEATRTTRTKARRLGDPAYHAGVALLALALGVGAFTAAPRAMSNTAAAAMDGSTVAPAAVGLRVDLIVSPAAPRPGAPVTFGYRVVDAHSGRVLTSLPLEHERPMHLIVVSRDLMRFQHIHPRLGSDGVWRVHTTLGTTGTYVLYNEFAHGGRTVIDRREVTLGRPSAAARLRVDLSPKIVDGTTIALSAPAGITTGSTARFTYHLTRAGRPVKDLVPYLAAAAHIAIVSQDTRAFAHTHGEVGGGMTSIGSGSMDMVAPPAHFGPDVPFSYTFPRPGLYKIWAQFAERGQILTVAFVVQAR